MTLNHDSIDRIDEDILYYLQHGRTNAYQVWKSLKIKSNESAIAYPNIWKRVEHLFDNGLIERIKVTEITMHGRKDYRVTKKGKRTVREHIDKLEQILE